MSPARRYTLEVLRALFEFIGSSMTLYALALIVIITLLTDCRGGR